MSDDGPDVAGDSGATEDAIEDAGATEDAGVTEDAIEDAGATEDAGVTEDAIEDLSPTDDTVVTEEAGTAAPPADAAGEEAPPPPSASPSGGLGPGEERERFGHIVRQYRMGVSGAALALAWTRQENAPHGATVIVEREVSPLGRLGRLWSIPPESTLSLAVVLRPALSVEEADATWLLAGLAAAEGAEAASGRKMATWWPDLVVDADTGEQVAALKVEVQLGPGKVRSAVASLRLDLDRLDLGAEGRDPLVEAILGSIDRNSDSLTDGAEGVAAAYDGRCMMLGRRVKLRLLPKGETRGVARGVDRSARLELESTTGMVQRITIDTLREIALV